MRFNAEAYNKLFPRTVETVTETESAIETFKSTASGEVETATEGEEETETDGSNDDC